MASEFQVQFFISLDGIPKSYTLLGIGIIFAVRVVPGTTAESRVPGTMTYVDGCRYAAALYLFVYFVSRRTSRYALRLETTHYVYNFTAAAVV